MHELWFDTSWHVNDLFVAAAANVALPAGTSPVLAGQGGSMTAYPTTWDANQHVVFVGNDGAPNEGALCELLYPKQVPVPFI